jgi:hypothetical protein
MWTLGKLRNIGAVVSFFQFYVFSRSTFTNKEVTKERFVLN